MYLLTSEPGAFVASRAAAPLIALIAVLVAGCQSGIPGLPLVPSSPKPFEQTFGPTYPATAPAGDLTRIDDAALVDAGQTLDISFVGGMGYAANDFCSTDYVPWVAFDKDELQVAITEITHPDQATIPPGVACAAIGHRYTFHLRLPRPFHGTTVQDMSGSTLWVGTPTGLVEPAKLPTGWVLLYSGDEPASQPPLFVRVYAAQGTDVLGANEGAGRLDVYQAFGAATTIGGGDEHHDVKVGNVPAVLMRDPASGELLLQWMVGKDGVALVANEADMTIAELLEIAAQVQAPCVGACPIATAAPPTTKPSGSALKTRAGWDGFCSMGVGLDMTLHGSASDPGLAWGIDKSTGARSELLWPDGYVAQFAPALLVLDATGTVVAHEGDLIIGTCIVMGQDALPDPLWIGPRDVRPSTWQPGDG